MDLRVDLDAVFMVHRTMPNRGPGGDAFWGLVHIGMRLGWERSGRGTPYVRSSSSRVKESSFSSLPSGSVHILDSNHLSASSAPTSYEQAPINFK